MTLVSKQHDEHHRRHFLRAIVGRVCRGKITVDQTAAKQSKPSEAIHIRRQFRERRLIRGTKKQYIESKNDATEKCKNRNAMELCDDW